MRGISSVESCQRIMKIRLKHPLDRQCDVWWSFKQENIEILKKKHIPEWVELRPWEMKKGR